MILETCDTIAAKNSMTVSFLLVFNPGLDCANLQKGQEVCVVVASFATSTTASTMISTTTTTTYTATSSSSQCTNSYVVKSGDYCTAIANNAGLSFPSFIALNKPIDCTNLQPGQVLCLARSGFNNYLGYQCAKLYQIPMILETCDTIAAKNSMTVSFLLVFNPGLDCANLQKGQEVCVVVGSFATSTTAPTMISTTTTTSAAALSVSTASTIITTTTATTTSAASSSSSQCTNSYVVKLGDYCTTIAASASLSFPSFIALNKPIDCTNLQPGQVLCLARTGFNNYPSYQCSSIYQIPMTLETCDVIAAKNSLSVSYLLFYNPGLDCSNLQKGQEICIGTNFVTNSFSSSTTTPVASTVPQAPTSSAASCTQSYTVKSGDYCKAIANSAGLSFPSFIALNKPLDCTTLQPGQTLCLARTGFSNYPSYPCVSVYQMPMTLETCDTVAAKNSLSVSYLLFYNPGLDCANLQMGQEFCINAGF